LGIFNLSHYLSNGNVYGGRNEFDKAKVMFAMALTIKPGKPEALSGLRQVDAF